MPSADEYKKLLDKAEQNIDALRDTIQKEGVENITLDDFVGDIDYAFDHLNIDDPQQVYKDDDLSEDEKKEISRRVQNLSEKLLNGLMESVVDIVDDSVLPDNDNPSFAHGTDFSDQDRGAFEVKGDAYRPENAGQTDVIRGYAPEEKANVRQEYYRTDDGVMFGLQYEWQPGNAEESGLYTEWVRGSEKRIQMVKKQETARLGPIQD